MENNSNAVTPDTCGEDIFCPTCGEPWDLLFTQDGRNLRCGANTCSACEAPGCEEVTS